MTTAITLPEGAPEEVVTIAKVRDIDLAPFGHKGTLALITLDNGHDHNRPNTLGPQSLASLDAAITEALSHNPSAIAVTGKPFIFAAGADLSALSFINNRAQALAIGKLGHDIFRRLDESKVPTFAFINGLALGGGLEIGLHCNYRTLSATAFTGLPEVFLGLVPGWGGATILPKLIGPEKAVQVIMLNALNNNTMMKAKDALALGVVDAVFEPADFLEKSVAFAAAVLSGSTKIEHKDYSSDPAWDSALATGKAAAHKKFGGADLAAPRTALELIAAAKSNSRGAGFDAEDQALADLTMSDPLRASLYAFNLIQKQELFKSLETIVSPECVLATNTSSLSVEKMSIGMKNPERVVGFHFFNPVAVMPLLEIARTSHTDDATTATAVEVGKNLKKTMIICKDAPGFVVNRLLTRFMGEITDAVDEGTDPSVADNAMRSIGFPMSPFELLGLVGTGVALHVAETLHENLGPRYRISPTMQAMVKEGVKTFYVKGDDGTVSANPAALALIHKGTTPSTAEEVSDRALHALAEEARMMLDEGVVKTPAEIDLCMLMGAGWPMHLGGILPYLDRIGVSEKVSGQRFHAPGIASVLK